MAVTHNSSKEELQLLAIARSLSKFTVMALMSFSFIYINTVMFFTLLSKSVLRETPRYILFAHMLFNDTIQLLFSSLIGFISFCCRPVKAACSVIILVTDSTSRIAPLNLAVMSLERYAAICFPLHHSEFVTVNKTYGAIASVWLLGLVNPVVDSVYNLLTDSRFFTEKVTCVTDGMFVTTPWQESLYQALAGLYFVFVTIVIVYSYVSVMLVARSVSSEKSSAQKANRTLLLHLVQLLLILNTLLFHHIIEPLALVLSYEVYFDMRYAVYLLVILLPRCLSPLVYGLRDDSLRCLFVYHFKCGLAPDKKQKIHSMH